MTKTEKEIICVFSTYPLNGTLLSTDFFFSWEGKGGGPVGLLKVVKAIELKRDQESSILFFECSFPS